MMGKMNIEINSTNKPQYEHEDISGLSESELKERLEKANARLEELECKALKSDYSVAAASGILAGIIDSIYTGEFSLIQISQKGSGIVDRLIGKAAQLQGYTGSLSDKPDLIRFLENNFPLAADKAVNEFGGGLQHHLRDFSHHFSPIGLCCSLYTQFTGKVLGTDTAGNFIVIPLGGRENDLIGRSIPEKIVFGTVNWFFHLASDMAGSSGSVLQGRMGTGIPGGLVSLLKTMSAFPLFKNQNEKGYKEFSVAVSKLFNGTMLKVKDTNGQLVNIPFDFRFETGLAQSVWRQILPVLINELVVRVFFLLSRFVSEMINEKDWKAALEKVKHSQIQNRRTLDRMLAVSSLTFTAFDLTDAAVRAAVETRCNYILFGRKFAAKINYIGAARCICAVIKEGGNEHRECQLLKEKRILTEAKAQFTIKHLDDYSSALEKMLLEDLTEEIKLFDQGTGWIEQGLSSYNSDRVLQGCALIQTAVHKDIQFMDQAGFDEMMSSDGAFVL